MTKHSHIRAYGSQIITLTHHVTICLRELKAEATLIPDCLDINFPTDLVYFIAFFLLPQKLP